MSKHTKGPWSLFPIETGWIVNEKGGPGYVCTLSLISHRRDECEANANLIVSAPELLEALQMARDYIAAELAHRKEAYAGYPHKWSTEQEDLQVVDAAIRKATGG